MIKDSFEKRLCEWVEGLCGGKEVTCESMGKKNGDYMLRISGDIATVKKYLDGNGVEYAIFELLTRVSGNDKASRMNAIGELEEIGKKMLSGSLPNLAPMSAVEVYVLSHPTLQNRSNNGDEEYAARYGIKYLIGV